MTFLASNQADGTVKLGRVSLGVAFFLRSWERRAISLTRLDDILKRGSAGVSVVFRGGAYIVLRTALCKRL